MTYLVTGPAPATTYGEYQMSTVQIETDPAASPGSRAPVDARRSGLFGDTRGERWASGLLGALMACEAAIGMIVSFTTVNTQMVPAFGSRSPLVPVGIDAGILAFGLIDVLLTYWRIPKAMVRWFEWLLVAATVYLNASGAETGWARAAHITLPLLWVVSCEVVRHVVRDRLDVLTGTPTDPIPALVWLMYPFYALRTKRRMVRWQVKSYQQALLLDAALCSREARLEAEYGPKWKRVAPPGERLAYRLRERIPASLLAKALVADAEMDRAIAQAQGQAAPAIEAAQAGAAAVATAQIQALLSDTKELAANIVAGLAASRTLPGLSDPRSAHESDDLKDRRTLGSGPRAHTAAQHPADDLRTLGADPWRQEGSASPDPHNYDQRTLGADHWTAHAASRTLGADPRTPGPHIAGPSDPEVRTLGPQGPDPDSESATRRTPGAHSFADARPELAENRPDTSAIWQNRQVSADGDPMVRPVAPQQTPGADPADRSVRPVIASLPEFLAASSSAAVADPSPEEGSANPDPDTQDQRTPGADPRTLSADPRTPGPQIAGPSDPEVRTAGPVGPDPASWVPDPRRSTEDLDTDLQSEAEPEPDPEAEPELDSEIPEDPTCGGLWSAETAALARSVVAKMRATKKSVTRLTFLAAFRADGGAIGNDRRGRLYAYAISPDQPSADDELDLVDAVNGSNH